MLNQRLKKIFLGHTVFELNRKSSGMSLVEVLVATGIAGLAAAGSAGILKTAFENSKRNKEIQGRTSIGNYLLQFTDCEKTKADPGFDAACKNNASINLRDKNDNIILPANGREIDQVFLLNSCEAGEITITGKIAEIPDPFPMLSGVPIICGTNTVLAADNPINLTVSFSSAGKTLTINLKLTVQGLKKDLGNDRWLTEYKVDAASKTSIIDGDFPPDLARQILAGEITAQVINDNKNPNEPITFTAQLSLRNLVIDGNNQGDQTFTMSKSGKTLNLANNEGNLKALETSQIQDNSANCKIHKNNQQPHTGVNTVVLTKEAPCEFQLPSVQVKGFNAQTRYNVPIGTYWRYDYNKAYNLRAMDCNGISHDFPLSTNLSWTNDKSSTRTIFTTTPNQAKAITLGIDNGFLLAQPDGKVYLLVDAGVTCNLFYSQKTSKIAENLIKTLKKSSATFKNAGAATLLRPDLTTTFAAGSVIAIYDDTPDMGGNIDVDALTRFAVTNNIGLNWSTFEEDPSDSSQSAPKQ